MGEFDILCGAVRLMAQVCKLVLIGVTNMSLQPYTRLPKDIFIDEEDSLRNFASSWWIQDEFNLLAQIGRHYSFQRDQDMRLGMYPLFCVFSRTP